MCMALGHDAILLFPMLWGGGGRTGLMVRASDFILFMFLRV